MRRIMTLMVVLLLVFGLAACGGKTKEDTPNNTPAASDEIPDDTGDEPEPSSGAISRIRGDSSEPDELEPIPGEDPEPAPAPGTEPPEEKDDAEAIADDIEDLGDQGEEEEITQVEDLDDEETDVDFGDDII